MLNHFKSDYNLLLCWALIIMPYSEIHKNFLITPIEAVPAVKLNVVNGDIYED